MLLKAPWGTHHSTGTSQLPARAEGARPRGLQAHGHTGPGPPLDGRRVLSAPTAHRAMRWERSKLGNVLKATTAR